MAPVPDESAAPYILPWDDTERQRLRLQHRYLLECVYEKSPLPTGLVLPPTARVLDSGTGSAEWLMNVASIVPNTSRLDGVDITARLLPAEYSSNVHFAVHSVTSLPEDWTGTFDLIHQRLLLPSLRTNEWKETISEHFRVLKPGGHVMFIEITPEWPSGEGLQASEKVRDIVKQLHESRDLPFDCALRIPGWLTDAGFVDVEVKAREGPLGWKLGKFGEMGAKNHETVYRNMKKALMKNKGMGLIDSEEEYDALVDEVVKEWHEVGAHYVWHLITARKPVEQGSLSLL